MGTENRLNELQVHTRECDVWRWCATDIYFSMQPSPFQLTRYSSFYFFFYIYLSPFLSSTYLILIGLSLLPPPPLDSAKLLNWRLSFFIKQNIIIGWENENFCPKFTPSWTIKQREAFDTNSANSLVTWIAPDDTLERHKQLKYCPVNYAVWGSRYNESSFNLHLTWRV